MKLNKIWLMAVAVLGFTACQKADDLPLYKSGVAPVLSASTTAVAPPASDSLKPVITFSWSDPAYATDTAKVKYIIEIDSTGRNFSKAVSKVIIGTKSTTFLAKDFNSILLGFGFNGHRRTPQWIGTAIVDSGVRRNNRLNPRGSDSAPRGVRACGGRDRACNSAGRSSVD